MIKYFGAGYALMAWYGWIADYLHACHILNVVELSNDGTHYKPLEANWKDAANLSIANSYIETRVDTSRETSFEAIQLGYVKHHDHDCIINALIDHYEHTLMKDNKRNMSTLENIIMMMGGNTKHSLWHKGATINEWSI